MYELRSRVQSFWPDIQKPHQMENAARDIRMAPSIVMLMYQFQAATCSSMLEALVLVVVLLLSP